MAYLNKSGSKAANSRGLIGDVIIPYTPGTAIQIPGLALTAGLTSTGELLSTHSGTAYVVPLTGPVTDPTYEVQVSRVGGMVTLYGDEISAASAGGELVMDLVGLPAAYLPGGHINGLVLVTDNSVIVNGSYYIDHTVPQIAFGVGPTRAAFAGAGDAGVLPFTITYPAAI